MFPDPEHIGIDTLFDIFGSLVTEIMDENVFSVMAAANLHIYECSSTLITSKMV